MNALPTSCNNAARASRLLIVLAHPEMLRERDGEDRDEQALASILIGLQFGAAAILADK